MTMTTKPAMVIDPHSQWFLRVGEVLDDGRDWKVVDVGIGQPVSFEAWQVMHGGRAAELLRDAARDKFGPIVAANKRAKGRSV